MSDKISPKKKAVKKAVKKMAPKKVSLIKYADKRLKPPSVSTCSHPVYCNESNIVHIIPNQKIEIDTGLEIAIPPGQFIMATTNVPGLVVISSTFTGYQKQMKLHFWNITSANIEIGRFEEIANLYMCGMLGWE